MNFLKVYSLNSYKIISFKEIGCSVLLIFLQEESRPNLSRNRTFDNISGALAKHEISSGERRRVGNYF